MTENSLHNMMHTNLIPHKCSLASQNSLTMISVSFPPPNCHIILMGFVEMNNGCQCDSHSDGCRNTLVAERANNGVGMELHLRKKVADELA